jgi:hypothetical protein
MAGESSVVLAIYEENDIPKGIPAHTMTDSVAWGLAVGASTRTIGTDDARRSLHRWN